MDTAAAIAFLTLLVVALAGASILTWAYVGAGSLSILFWEVIPAPASLLGEALTHFQQGISAYRVQRYRQAIEEFNQARQVMPTLIEATHNIGLAFANLRQDDRATEQLLKAADGYLERGDRSSVGLVRLHLSALRNRKGAP
ncbi:MAG: hypothetical protein VKJ24_14800 [Synechococcales bacterium]|nr:hypothetical protein [Synechococcales bacterium]